MGAVFINLQTWHLKTSWLGKDGGLDIWAKLPFLLSSNILWGHRVDFSWFVTTINRSWVLSFVWAIDGTVGSVLIPHFVTVCTGFWLSNVITLSTGSRSMSFYLSVTPNIVEDWPYFCVHSCVSMFWEFQSDSSKFEFCQVCYRHSLWDIYGCIFKSSHTLTHTNSLALTKSTLCLQVFTFLRLHSYKTDLLNRSSRFLWLSLWGKSHTKVI